MVYGDTFLRTKELIPRSFDEVCVTFFALNVSFA